MLTLVRPLVIVLLTASAVVAVTPVVDAAADGLDGDVYVEAFDAGGYYFRIDGLKGRNPDVTLTPGETVLIEVRNVAHEYHNIHFGDPVNKRTGLLQPGANALLEFTVPVNATGESTYWCDPHRRLGMMGTLTFSADEPAEARIPSAAPPVIAGTLLALALVTRRARREAQDSSRP